MTEPTCRFDPCGRVCSQPAVVLAHVAGLTEAIPTCETHAGDWKDDVPLTVLILTD